MNTYSLDSVILDMLSEDTERNWPYDGELYGEYMLDSIQSKARQQKVKRERQASSPHIKCAHAWQRNDPTMGSKRVPSRADRYRHYIRTQRLLAKRELRMSAFPRQTSKYPSYYSHQNAAFSHISMNT